jgi:hypothetical protein
MKVLKIFLKLKWDETIGKIIFWKNLGKFLLIFCSLVGSITAIGVLLGYSAKLLHIIPKTVITISDTIFFGLFLALVGSVVFAIGWCIVSFLKWIRSNWQEAKRIAKEK